VPSGPILENIQRDGEVDIFKFPIPFVHEHDGGRYIGTEDLVVMRDPDSDWVNVGDLSNRRARQGRGRRLDLAGESMGVLIREKYFAQGLPCPVADLLRSGSPFSSCAAMPNFRSAFSEFDYAGWATRQAGGGRV